MYFGIGETLRHGMIHALRTGTDERRIHRRGSVISPSTAPSIASHAIVNRCSAAGALQLDMACFAARRRGREVRRVDGNPHYRPHGGPSAATKCECEIAGVSLHNETRIGL